MCREENFSSFNLSQFIYQNYILYIIVKGPGALKSKGWPPLDLYNPFQNPKKLNLYLKLVFQSYTAHLTHVYLYTGPITINSSKYMWLGLQPLIPVTNWVGLIWLSHPFKMSSHWNVSETLTQAPWAYVQMCSCFTCPRVDSAWLFVQYLFATLPSELAAVESQLLNIWPQHNTCGFWPSFFYLKLKSFPIGCDIIFPW